MAIEYELREGIVWEMIASAEQGNTWRPVASITGPLAVRETIRRLMDSAEYALRVEYKSEDCGDHCGNGCYWCDLRNEVARAKQATS